MELKFVSYPAEDFPQHVRTFFKIEVKENIR